MPGFRDSTHLGAGAEDGSLTLWHVSSARPVLAVYALPGEETSSVATPDGYVDVLGQAINQLVCGVGAFALPASACLERLRVPGL